MNEPAGLGEDVAGRDLRSGRDLGADRRRPRASLASMPGAERLAVPGLWEAQGHLGLDGVAWYRRRFEVPTRAGGGRCGSAQ